MSTHRVVVEEHAAGKLIDAELDDLLPIDALLEIEDAWEQPRREMIRALRRAQTPREQWPQSLHWDWAGKSVLVSLHQRPDNYRAFGLRVGSEWQGAR